MLVVLPFPFIYYELGIFLFTFSYQHIFICSTPMGYCGEEEIKSLLFSIVTATIFISVIYYLVFRILK